MEKLQATIIGELFLDDKDKYLGAVKDYYFTDPKCRLLFSVLKKCKYRNDILSLQKQLLYEGHTNVEDIIKDLMECMDNAGDKISLGNHIEVLRQEVVVNKVRDIVFESNGQLKKEDLDTIHKLTAPMGLKDYTIHTLKDLALNFPEEYEKRKVLYANGVPYPTGFRGIDSRTGGILMRNLTVVGGRTSFGKTALMTNIAINLAKHDVKTLYLSCEMEGVELFDRVLANQSSVESFKIKFAQVDDCEIGRMVSKISENDFYLKPLAICYTPGLTYNAVATLIDEYRPKVLFIDHLQIMRHDSTVGRPQAMEDTCYKLKDLSGDYDIGIVLGSQISRDAVKGGGSTKMSPAFYKGSGGIEDSATVAMEIKLAEEEDKEKAEWLMDVEVQKARFGPVGTVRMLFERKYARFRELPL